MAEAKAEEALRARGVFKGEHGLRGLLETDAFWEDQPYGTRLYYGCGIAEYLHRSVLRAAVSALEEQAELRAEVSRLQEREELWRELDEANREAWWLAFDEAPGWGAAHKRAAELRQRLGLESREPVNG